MANKTELWKLHSLAASYSTRPSAFVGLAPTSWEAYNFDLAVLQLGRWIENMLAEHDKDGKPIHRIGDLLSDRPAEQQQFRSMKGAAIRKMAIPENGIW